MELDFSDCSLLVIAGGNSSRMGLDKRWTEVGGMGLLDRTLEKARNECFGEIFLCVEEAKPRLEKLAKEYGARILTDRERGMGPMTGLAQGLLCMKTEWALALAGDMPFFSFEAIRQLLPFCVSDVEAVLPVALRKRQPLAAMYRRSMADIFAKAIEKGNRKLLRVLEQVQCHEVEVEDGGLFFNVNTPADLRLARGRMANLSRRVPVISVVAPASGTGKTTFIEGLLPRLKARGLRVGVVKSDAHGFQLDVEGKDSWRFQQSGAQSVAVVAPSGWVLFQRTQERATLEQVAEKMNEVDLVLTESRTHGTVPAISLWRGKGAPLLGEDVVALFAKGLPAVDEKEMCRFDLDDMDRATELCLFLMGK